MRLHGHLTRGKYTAVHNASEPELWESLDLASMGTHIPDGLAGPCHGHIVC